MKTNLKLKQLQAKLDALKAAKDVNLAPKVKSSIESQKGMLLLKCFSLSTIGLTKNLNLQTQTSHVKLI